MEKIFLVVTVHSRIERLNRNKTLNCTRTLFSDRGSNRKYNTYEYKPIRRERNEYSMLMCAKNRYCQRKIFAVLLYSPFDYKLFNVCHVVHPLVLISVVEP